MAKVAIQGGVKNYLGKKKTVTVPKDWQSSPDHPTTELAYITKAEKDLLLKKDLHNSLNGKPNRGPSGVMSLNGWGDKGDNSDRSFGGGERYDGGNNNPNQGGSGTGGDNSNKDYNPNKGTKEYNETVKNIQKAKREEEARQQARQDAEKKRQEKESTQRAIEFEKSKKQTKKDRTAKLKRILTSKNKNLINTLGLSAMELRDLQVQGLYDPITGFKNPEDFGLLDSNPTSGLYGLLEKDDRFSGANQYDFQNSYDSGGFKGPVLSLLDPFFKKGAKKTKEFFTDDVLKSGKYKFNGLTVTPDMFKMMSPSQMDEVYGSYMDDRQSGKTDAYGNPNPGFGPGSGGGNDPIIYTPPDDTTDDTTDDETTYAYRFGNPNENEALDVTLGYYAANGGRVPRNMGGIMNAVPRQGYFLGKIVKGVGKAIGSVADAAGKVLKSDVGKMALLAGGAYLAGGYLPGGGGIRGGFSNFSNLGKNLLLKDRALGFTGNNLSLGKILGLSAVLPFIPGLNKVPPNEDIGMTARGGSLIDPLTRKEAVPAEMRASLNEALDSADGNPDKIKAITNAYAFLGPDERLGTYLPYRTYGVKDGGRIGRAEGGLMNLGGMEKDYRAEGGFVPIGREEKADDVPARLSVNEFVFTADAVRNAGGGDIDRGAEVMENMMKNLENGGRVSEESQGNTGAQDMFSVSERIGEVI